MDSSLVFSLGLLLLTCMVNAVVYLEFMITSSGMHGHGEEALTFFVQTGNTNVQLDAITFVGGLCACVHTNNVDKGFWYFQYMRENYGITPTLEHYTCMIELL